MKIDKKDILLKIINVNGNCLAVRFSKLKPLYCKQCPLHKNNCHYMNTQCFTIEICKEVYLNAIRVYAMNYGTEDMVEILV